MKRQSKSMMINIGKSCRLNCKICYEHRGPIPYDFDEYFQKIKAEVKSTMPTRVTIFENRKSDPMSEPRLPEILDFLESVKSVRKVTVVTSGLYEMPETFLKYKKIQWGVSVDGPKEMHEANRGQGNYQKAISFAQARKKEGFTVCVRPVLTKLASNSNSFMNWVKKFKKDGFQVLLQEFISRKRKKSALYVNPRGVRIPKGINVDNLRHNEPSVCIDPLGIFNCANVKFRKAFQRSDEFINGPCYYCGYTNIFSDWKFKSRAEKKKKELEEKCDIKSDNRDDYEVYNKSKEYEGDNGGDETDEKNQNCTGNETVINFQNMKVKNVYFIGDIDFNRNIGEQTPFSKIYEMENGKLILVVIRERDRIKDLNSEKRYLYPGEEKSVYPENSKSHKVILESLIKKEDIIEARFRIESVEWKNHCTKKVNNIKYETLHLKID